MEPKWFVAGVSAFLALNLILSLTIHAVYATGVTPSTIREANVTDCPSINVELVKESICTTNMRRNLHALTKKAHVAGTENNFKVAEFIRQQMIQQGLDNVHFNEYDVLLSYPNWSTPNTLEIVGENGETVFRTTGRSPVIVKEEQNDPSAEIQWFAYSANGVAEGDVVYVNKATKDDFEHVESLGIDLKGKILLARHSGMYRGNIAQLAVAKGAVGCLIYSDPVQVASWGTSPNETFMSTDKMPPDAVQRGSLYVGSGDPRTPAFPSLKGLYKEKDEEQVYAEKRIPTIPVLPIPYSAAQILFENMNGDIAIPAFQGKLDVEYRYGPGLGNKQKLRMTVHARNEERTIHNVLGYIEGQSQELVVLGNHFDAWTYGAVDPNSGTTVLLEVSRALKAYQNATGWVPARSILFAHWDAEEYGFIGSAEFTEEFRVQLMSRVVAVVNMDLIGGNQTLFALASPIIVDVLRKAAARTSHPNEMERSEGRMTMYDSWKHFYPSKNNRSSHPNCGLPAGGSDHASFFDYLGIPIISFITSSLDAPFTYPLYHTAYETPYLTEHILDPKFQMHKAIAQMFIEMAVQFSESDILPYDLWEFMADVENVYIPALSQNLASIQTNDGIEKYLKSPLEQFELLQKSVNELSQKIEKRKTKKLDSPSLMEKMEENRRLIEFEKCFLNPRGTPGSPEARHVLYHPSPEDWYRGGVMLQVHSLISKMSTSSDEEQLRDLSKRLSMEIAVVNVAFICARHSLDRLPSP